MKSACYIDILEAVAANQQFIRPTLFTACHGRAAASAAFKLAIAEGVIEVAFINQLGRPTYRAAGVGAASVQAALGVTIN